MNTLKSRSGYYELSKHAIGGDFKRASIEGLTVTDIKPLERVCHGCDSTGIDEYGKPVAFNSRDLVVI